MTSPITAKTIEKAVKADWDNCRAVFGDCNGFKDMSPSYISKCKTSPTNLKKILFSLYKSKDALSKVTRQITISLSTIKTQAGNLRSLVDCKSLSAAVSLFSQNINKEQVDTLGNNELIKKLATIIIGLTNTSITTCTVAEKTLIKSSKTSITTMLAKVDSRITEVVLMLSDLTGTSIAAAEIASNIVTIPVTVETTTSKTVGRRRAAFLRRAGLLLS